MSHATVEVNGVDLGGWPYGYASFAVRLNPALKPGRNEITVHIDNPEESSRWYPGGGIYRNVWLTKTNRTSVAHWGTYVTTEIGPVNRILNQADALVTLRVTLKHAGEKTVGMVRTQIIRQDRLKRDGESAVPHHARAEGPRGIHRMQLSSFGVLMSVNLAIHLVPLNVRAVPEEKIQPFYDQLATDGREHHLIHIIGKIVMISLDEKDLSVQPFPVFPQIGLSAIAKVTDIKDLIVRSHDRIPFGNQLFFLRLREYRSPPRTGGKLPRPKVMVARHKLM
jgi:hypothetical protein